MRSISILGFVWVLAMTLAGCSTARLGYAALPTWLMWQLDGYLSLESDQRQAVSRRIDEIQHWHRQTQLTQYAAFLREIDDKAHAGIGVEDFDRWRDQIDAAWRALAAAIAPGMVELLVSLKPEQIERLKTKFEESNRKQFKDHGMDDPDDRLAARTKRVIKRAEFFLGDLTREQERQVAASSAKAPPAEDAWMAERLARQRGLLELIDYLQNRSHTPGQAHRMGREYLLTLGRSRDAGRRAALARAADAGDALSVMLFRRASEAQKKHLSHKLRAYAHDFSVMARAD